MSSGENSYLSPYEMSVVADIEFVMAKQRIVGKAVHLFGNLANEFVPLFSQKIMIPSLRQRKDDIPDLVNHFIENERPSKNKTVDAEAIEQLKSYDWPGNVRELKRITEQLCLISPLPMIRSSDVQTLLKTQSKNQSNLIDSAAEPFNLELGLETVLKIFEKKMIETALKQFHTDIDETAQYLKVSRSNLYKKIKDLKITES